MYRGCLLSLAVLIFTCTNAPDNAVEARVVVLGAGASFPREVYDSWNAAYQQMRAKHIDLDMRYESIGSGGGKARIKGEKEPMVHYAGSDSLLTEAEILAHPDLKMIPTLVGAVVLAYNLPGLDQLTLSLEAVTGMYNGSIQKWNDPIIKALNPNESIPDTAVTVISRSDKSGTTEAFTRGLSAYSQDWNSTYGIFSVGLNDHGMPIHWNRSVIKYFGATNRGMHGMILSLRYSIGYMSIADVKKLGIPYASMKNRDGFVVDVNITTVQSAVVNAHGTLDIMNQPGPLSFPLVTYTYFIVNMKSTFECEAMVELVRYIDWFFNSERAKTDAMYYYFTSLDTATYSDIELQILHNMTCGGKYLWDVMMDQMVQESITPVSKAWELPTYLTVSTLVLIIIALIAIFTRQQLIIHKEILKNSWLISPEIIGADHIDSVGNFGIGNIGQESENESNNYVGSVFTPEDHARRKYCFGNYEEQVLILIPMVRVNSISTIKQKKTLLALRDSVNHGNVMKFIGITNSEADLYSCFLGKVRISLSGLLGNRKVTINDGAKVSIVKEVVSGMKYLHKKGIVHGYLRSECIMVDMAWNIRITSWIETTLFTQDKRRTLSNKIQPADKCFHIAENDDENALYWVAPEIIKYQICPVYSSDVYSFSMVMQEIFSRKQPYEEIRLTPKEIIDAILTCCLRPKFYPKTPSAIKSLMESCWGVDPAQRPNFHAVEGLLKHEYPNNTHLLGTIIESMQQYATSLRRDLADSLKEMETMKTRLHGQMTCYLPDALVPSVLSGQSVEATSHSQATVMAFKITNLPQLMDRVTSHGIVNTLNKFYDAVDSVLTPSDVFKVNRSVNIDLYVAGTPKPNPKHAVTMCHCALKVLTSVEEFAVDHLEGLDCNLNVAIAISSGALVAGILGKITLQYVVIGQPLTEAAHLLDQAEPGTIQMSEQTYSLVTRDSSLLTSCSDSLKGTVYTLHGTNPTHVY